MFDPDSASDFEDAAKKILSIMEDQFSEVTEHSLQPKSPMNMQFTMGYGAAMHDLRHVIGDLFPSLKQ